MAESAIAFCGSCGEKNDMQWIDGQMRPVCTACGHITYIDPKAAAVTFITHEDKVLLVQRRYDPGKGLWGLPGGFIEYGEDPRETARREVEEETGLIVEIGAVLDVFFVENGVITIAYAGKYLGGEPQALDDALAVRWFTHDTLPELVFRSTVTLCARWVEKC